ncbi:hypothetical protein B0H66DRAFT_599598 [Apodospora peruviana]|uniref:Uncharacterized protein n=1 Tax=Apodospora peruviana TaxID=516989 RepID=A0AAE0IHY2_9PEZI|nr:hypothetical protein B0H66DRAFT_599598 [Apodospora peruviana]
MLAPHREDQENRFSHQTGPSKQQLHSKTPGARYPKTPLKVPLNDENANRGFGGKSALRTKGNNENITTVGKGTIGLGKTNRANIVTPAEPRTARAPLGNKTTNAKARTGQQTGGVKSIVREFEKTTTKPATSVRPRQGAPQVESSKLEVHTDKNPLEEEEDIEYAPPKPKELPYESDVFTDGAMTFEGLKPENMFKGYYQYYFNHVDDNGMSLMERQMEERRQRDFQRGDEQIRKDVEEFDWSIGDVPSSKDMKEKEEDTNTGILTATKLAQRQLQRPPATIASRKAASALAMALKPSTSAQAKILNKPAQLAKKTPLSLLVGRKPVPKTAPLRNSSQERATAVVASRSTLGYSKGRSALSAVRGRDEPANIPEEVTATTRTLMRSVSTASSGSDRTITPARFAQTQESEDWKKLEFLSIFDVDEEDGNLGGTPQFDDDLDDDFQLSTDF